MKNQTIFLKVQIPFEKDLKTEIKLTLQLLQEGESPYYNKLEISKALGFKSFPA